MKKLTMWIILLALTSAGVYGATVFGQLHRAEDSYQEATIAFLEARITRLEDPYINEVAPVKALLSKRARAGADVSGVAWAVVKEARKAGVSPMLVASVIVVENPWLIPDTVSYAGAVGLMQVMPFHANEPFSHKQCTGALDEVEANLCYGMDILRTYLRTSLRRALKDALLRYNGCWKTEGCERYADLVLQDRE